MNCRSCNSPTTPILSLGKMPLANKLLRGRDEWFKTFPLDLEFCGACKLGQLRDLITPADLFDDYVYYAGASGPNVRTAWELASDIYKDRRLRANSLVVEIGSNDGYLLKFYETAGVSILGIDPAKGPANQAALAGIPTVQDYFTLALSRTLPKADVIHAHNVLAHVPDLNDFAQGIAELLKPDGIAVIEVPYLGDMVEKASFDLIYHEHVYYFSMTAAFELFARHGLGVTIVERIPAQGGSLRLFLSKGATIDGTTVDEEFDFEGLVPRIKSQTTALLEFLLRARREGKSTWGYGASAKATIMLNFCEIDSTLLAGIADTTGAKIGKYIPGTGLRITHPQDWLDAQPDYTCVFAWNYAQEIAHRYRRDYQGKMFTPYILPAATE